MRKDCHTAPARGRFQASTHMVTFIREECYFSINQTVLRRRPKADTQMSRSPREGTFPRQGCLKALKRNKFQVDKFQADKFQADKLQADKFQATIQVQ